MKSAFEVICIFLSKYKVKCNLADNYRHFDSLETTQTCHDNSLHIAMIYTDEQSDLLMFHSVT